MKTNDSYTVYLENQTSEPSDKFVVKYFEQEDILLHDHDCFELAYVVKGSAIQNLNGITEEVRQGAYFIIDHGSQHNYQKCKNLKLINCLFLPEVLGPSLSNCISFDELMRISMVRYYKKYPDWTPVNNIFYDDDKRVLRLLEEMMAEYQQKEIGYQEIFRGKLTEVLLLTLRKGVHQREYVAERTYDRSTLVLEAIDYLEKEYKTKAPLSRFCEEVHYSIQYTSKLFKKETGLTFLEYLQKVRVKKSCDLLIESDLPVLEVAYQVGYDNLKYFQEIFRKTVGMTPSEYRKAAKSVEESR